MRRYESENMWIPILMILWGTYSIKQKNINIIFAYWIMSQDETENLHISPLWFLWRLVRPTTHPLLESFQSAPWCTDACLVHNVQCKEIVYSTITSQNPLGFDKQRY